MTPGERYAFGWAATGRSVAEAMRLEGREEMSFRDWLADPDFTGDEDTDEGNDDQ